MRKVITHFIFALLATGMLAGCVGSDPDDSGAEGAGQGTWEPGDDWYPATARFSVGPGTPGNREVTFTWGGSAAYCGGKPETVGCGYPKASVTLNEAELVDGTTIQLAGHPGYVSKNDAYDGTDFPRSCTEEANPVVGQMLVHFADLGRGSLSVEISNAEDETFNGVYEGFSCEEAEPSVDAVFEVVDGSVRLKWGNVQRTCDDSTAEVSCEEAKGEATIPADQVAPGRLIYFRNIDTLGAESSADSCAADPFSPRDGELELFMVTRDEIRFTVSGRGKNFLKTDGYYSATRCN